MWYGIVAVGQNSDVYSHTSNEIPILVVIIQTKISPMTNIIQSESRLYIVHGCQRWNKGEGGGVYKTLKNTCLWMKTFNNSPTNTKEKNDSKITTVMLHVCDTTFWLFLFNSVVFLCKYMGQYWDPLSKWQIHSHHITLYGFQFLCLILFYDNNKFALVNVMKYLNIVY